MSRNLDKLAFRRANRPAAFWRAVSPTLSRVESRYGAAYAAKARRIISETLSDLGAQSAILAAHDASRGML